MGTVFITGSADGLGRLAARRLVERGHEVVLHGRDERRAREAVAGVPGAAAALAGDLASIAETRALAEQVNARGPFDAVIHNAGVYLERRRTVTEDGLARVFQIDALAPYLLTALITPPRRLVYLSSGVHRSGDPDLSDLQWERRRWEPMQAYADAKLFDVVLAFAIARSRPSARSNAVDPGWVPTKMGGPGAPGDLELGAETQVWLAAGDDPAADVSGRYFHHRRAIEAHPAAGDAGVQDGLLDACRSISGVAMPAAA